MPAKKLTEEQREDARRLKAAFKAWQTARKQRGEPWAQDAIAEKFFGFGQSALAQYLNGTIPLNPDALKKFCTALRLPPAAISPSITEREIARAFDWIAVEPPQAPGLPPGVIALPPPDKPRPGSGLLQTAEQKRRRPAGKPSRQPAGKPRKAK